MNGSTIIPWCVQGPSSHCQASPAAGILKPSSIFLILGSSNDGQVLSPWERGGDLCQIWDISYHLVTLGMTWGGSLSTWWKLTLCTLDVLHLWCSSWYPEVSTCGHETVVLKTVGTPSTELFLQICLAPYERILIPQTALLLSTTSVDNKWKPIRSTFDDHFLPLPGVFLLWGNSVLSTLLHCFKLFHVVGVVLTLIGEQVHLLSEQTSLFTARSHDH